MATVSLLVFEINAAEKFINDAVLHKKKNHYCA